VSGHRRLQFCVQAPAASIAYQVGQSATASKVIEDRPISPMLLAAFERIYMAESNVARTFFSKQSLTQWFAISGTHLMQLSSPY